MKFIQNKSILLVIEKQEYNKNSYTETTHYYRFVIFNV